MKAQRSKNEMKKMLLLQRIFYLYMILFIVTL